MLWSNVSAFSSSFLFLFCCFLTCENVRSGSVMNSVLFCLLVIFVIAQLNEAVNVVDLFGMFRYNFFPCRGIWLQGCDSFAYGRNFVLRLDS